MRKFGDTPVPYTVSWTGEEQFFVGLCPYSERRAIRQIEAPGIGKPLFGKPHSDRQRKAIALDLCDTCGKPLKNRTKVSLSHARPRHNGATGMNVLQVEPMLHRECAAISMRYCPSLRRDIASGSLSIRQVTKSRTQFAVMDAEYVRSLVPDFVLLPSDGKGIIGHAKVELLAWKDRDEAWLSGAD